MTWAKITLRQAQLDRLVKGESVVVRLRDTELEVRLDCTVILGKPDFLSALFEKMGKR
jgi:hypothetical protein